MDTMSPAAAALLQRLTERSALIGVIGLGYVGLPLSMAFTAAGARAMGFDIDPAKSEAIMAGKSYIHHISADRIDAAVKEGLLTATADMTRLNEPDAILICVPTPLTKHLEPDLSFVESTGAQIARALRPGQLVVLESTTYPGTTTEILLPILERSGLKAGKDFFLAFSPEREDPGNPAYATAQIPKIVGADDNDSRILARALYDTFAVRTVPVSSCAAAEAVKITENIFRAVNIALANEMKLIYGAMGLNVWEIIDAAKTKPFGYMAFYPGPGLGGHCIPIDPFYLTWKAKEYNVHTRFIELAGQINSAMPEHVVQVAAEALSRRARKSVNGARILLLGLAYKKNVDDCRESPTFRLIELLEERGAETGFYDPYIATVPSSRHYGSLAGRPGITWNAETIASFDAVIISTDHDNVDYVELCRHARLVIDARNACARAGADLTNVVLA